MSFDDDLSMMIAAPEFSVAVTYGAETCRGYFNDTEDVVAADQGTAFSIRSRTLFIQTGDLTSPDVDTSITAGGVVYNITAIEPKDDGKITALQLTT